MSEYIIFCLTIFLSNKLYFFFSNRTKSLSWSFYTFESNFIPILFFLFLLHNLPCHISHDLHYMQAKTRTRTRTQYDIMFYTTSMVAVPYSLGPNELLARYGIDEQKSYFLPWLVDGTLIPCFGLTSPHSWSDATSLHESDGIMEERDNVLGVRIYPLIFVEKI